MRAAEDALEVTARRQLVERDDVVAVRRGVHVRPHEAAHRVVNRKVIARHDSEWASAGEMDPPQVADHRQVCRCGAHRQTTCEGPVGIRRRARAGVAVDPHRAEAPLVALLLEGDHGAQRPQPLVTLDVVQHAQIPPEGPVTVAGHVTGEGARHRQGSEVELLDCHGAGRARRTVAGARGCRRCRARPARRRPPAGGHAVEVPRRGRARPGRARTTASRCDARRREYGRPPEPA